MTVTRRPRSSRLRPLFCALAGFGSAALLIPALAGTATAATRPVDGGASTTSSALAPLVGANTADVVPGQYIVVLKSGAAPRAAGVSAPSRLSAAAVVSQQARRASSAGGRVTHTYSHAFSGYSATLSSSALAAVRSDPAVAYVQANHVIEEAAVSPQPNGVGAVQTKADWGLARIDQRTRPSGSSYYFQNTGSGVTAYVVDTGVRSTSRDFTTDLDGAPTASRVQGGVCDIPVGDPDNPSVGCDDNGTAGCSTNNGEAGHGTHVAGTIGGTVYGVAKEVTLVPVRVLDCEGSGTDDSVVAGLDWIVSDHEGSGTPAVANMSLASDNGADEAVEVAVQRVIDAGVTVVVAAGNGEPDDAGDYAGVDACGFSPADVTDAITVGASTETDARADYSNYGPCVDLYAPGENITSDWNTSDNATEILDGTSMATPHVAGAAALYLQNHPDATPADVQTALVKASTADVVTNVSKRWQRRLLFSLQTVKAPSATVGASSVGAGKALLSGKSIVSPNKKYTLVQTATGLWLKAGKTTLWSSKAASSWTQLMADGDLISSDTYGRVTWKSGTAGAATLKVNSNGTATLTDNATHRVTWKVPK